MSSQALDVDRMLDLAVEQMGRALLEDHGERALRWANVGGVLLEGSNHADHQDGRP